MPATRPITATFELEDEDLRVVEEAHGQGVLASRLVTVAKTYENELLWEIDYDEKRHVELAMEEAGLDTAVVQDVDTWDGLMAKLRAANARQEDLDRFLRTRAGRGYRSEIQRIIEERLPRFLYFDEFSVMSGRVSVPKLRSGDKGALNPGERTTLSLIRLANVDLAEFTRDEYEARRASLEAAANQLTNDVFVYWSQNRSLSVEFDVDFDGARAGAAGEGPFIELRVRNHRHGVTLNFNERSQGFTWFFSLLATLSELRHSKRMILLLDEPGLSLHASAQHDLLRFIDERLTPDHQVLYSTHSPFMVASTDLERVRTVEDRDGEGTRVSHEFLDHSEDTRLPLQAALGQELFRSLPAGPGTLLVERPSDHVFLTAMSGHLEARGRSYLDPRWTIVPVGGLAGVSAFVALLGSRTNLAVLVDVPGGGNPAAASPVTRKLIAEKGIIRLADFTETRADDARVEARAGGGTDIETRADNDADDAGADDDLGFDDAGVDDERGFDDAGVDDGLGFDDADIEDLFSDDFYVNLVNRSGAATIEPFEIHGAGRIVRRIEMATGLGLDRYLPARLLLGQQADPISELDDETFDRFEYLLIEINGLLR